MFNKLITLLAVPALVGAQQVSDTTYKQQALDTTYKPISLADAVRLAKENNVSSITATNAVRSANLLIRSTKAQLYPSVTGSMGQSKSQGDRIGQSGTLVPYNGGWTYQNGITLQQTLFDGGKTFADVRARKADVVSAQANETTQEFGVALNVKLEYNTILAAKEQEAAARAQLTLAQTELDVSIAKVNAGAANVSDSLNNVVLVGTAQIAILSAQQNLRTASASLTRLVGTPYLVTANPADTVDLPRTAIDSASLMAMALDGPTIRQSVAQLASSQAAERSAKTGYLPTIGANFSYAGNGTGPYGLGNNPFPYTRGVTLSLSYPIFNRFSRENGVALAQINADNAQAQIKDAKLGAQQTIITQIGLLRNDEEQIRVQLVSIRAAEEALRVNQARYSLGAGTMVDLLTSQSLLIAARQNLIQTRLNYRNARATIEAAIGRDLP